MPEIDFKQIKKKIELGTLNYTWVFIAFTIGHLRNLKKHNFTSYIYQILKYS